MYLYIFYKQVHPSRNILAYLLSKQTDKKKIFGGKYKNIENICKKWNSINYKILEKSLGHLEYNSKNLEKIITKIFNKNIEGILYYPFNRWNVPFTKILSETSFKKIIYVDDIHTKNKSKADFSLCNKFDKILCSYSYKTSEVCPILNTNKIISFPHYIPDHMIKNNKIVNNGKILLTGICSKKCPSCNWRKSAYNARYNIYKKLFNKLDILCIHQNIIGDNYYQLINNYLGSVSTPGNIGYIVAKYFEIPGSNSVLIAYNKGIENSLEKLGFINGENYLGFNDENYMKVFNDIKNKKLDIDKIRQNGNDLIKNRHKLSDRIKYLNNLF